jgi:hypothetical protein
MKNLFKAFVLTLAFWPMFHMIFSALVLPMSRYETYTEAFFDHWCIVGSLIQLPVYSIIVYAKLLKAEKA